MKEDIIKYLEQHCNVVLNDQQKKAALHFEGPAAVLAVPGSGKTTVLMARTANLIINHDINPTSILSLTFNKAAVYDMQRRFEHFFGDMVPSPGFSTIHAFALRVIRAYLRHTSGSVTIIEGDNSTVNKNMLLRDIYRQVNNDFPGDDKLEELIRGIGYVKNMMLKGDEIKQANIQVDGFIDIYRRYESFKDEHNYIDFDDMLTKCLDILLNTKGLLSSCRKTYPFVQVDEFQDNSKIQNEIIKLLVAPSNNLFVVADDDQSIYGFRGAYPKGILDFKKDYKGAKLFFMERNFRSVKNIVDSSNTFIKSNLERYEKNMYTERVEDEKVNIIRVKNEREQMDAILEGIERYGDSSKTAVLFRNNISAVTLADELSRRGKPFYMKDSKLHFFKHWVTEDILAFIRLSQDPRDMNAFKRIYYKTKCYVSKEALEMAAKNQKNATVFEALIFYSGLATYQRTKVKELEEDLRYIVGKKPEFVLTYIEANMGYREYLEESGPKRGYSVDTLKSILMSLKSIARHTKTIPEFLDRLDTLKMSIEQAIHNRGKDAVVLSTIHSSKGLEFDNVYMIDLVKGIFPAASVSDEIDEDNARDMEEERRLFYVGMTRAKTNLTLFAMTYRNGEFSEMSPFLKELYPIVGIKEEDKKSLQENDGYESDPDCSEYTVGKVIEHKLFGTGTIQSIEDGTMNVVFDKVGIKTLNLAMCVSRKLIHL